MTIELQAEALCDHRVHREYLFLDLDTDPTYRTLRLFQPIANDKVRLWYNGKEYKKNDPTHGWNLIADELSAAEDPRKKIVFNRSIRDIEALFEVSYTSHPNLCRKCYGIGILYDNAYTKAGKPVFIAFEQKLIQQVIKILFTKMGSNPFITGYGTEIPDMVYKGIKDPGSMLRDLSSEIAVAFQKLRNIQYFQSEVQYLNERELLDQLIDLNVSRSDLDPRVFFITVELSTLAGDSITINRELFLGENLLSSPIREAGI